MVFRTSIVRRFVWCALAVGGASVGASCTLVGADVDHLAAGDAVGSPACPQECQGLCVDVMVSSAHCGACGNACQAGEVCVAGSCKIACPGGQVECGGLCFATSNDPRHCGSCEAVCKPGEVCGDGQCSSSCPTGQTNCGGSCADTRSDAKHCGVCGTACGPNDECVEGKCLIACRTQLNQPITDPWGWSWDGLERAAAPFTEAKQTCAAFRGRLPTVSELHRVSATQSATVGQTIHTNPLWSAAPAGGAATHARLRLSDSNITDSADTTANNYRCVCAPPLPKVYIGGNCYAASGSAAPCVTLQDENKKHNLDTRDRPPVRKATAIWECGFYGGRLASTVQLTEYIQQGIGPGSDEWLATSDEVHHQYGGLVRWSNGQNFLFQYTTTSNSLSWSDNRTPRAFRCVGENFAPTPPPAIPGEWSGSQRRKVDAADQGAAQLIDAVDSCWKRGGHLPTMAELGEQVLQGLPGGTGAWLWTSDQTGHNSTNFTVAVTKWTGAGEAYLYGAGDMTWSYKTDSRPHRCIFYPIDPGYAGPPAASCSGGCTMIPMPAGSANANAKMWIDAFDRAPPATVTVAIDTCRKVGGHLATERDLTEAIRAGLANGSGVEIHTSDSEIGNQGGLLVGVVKWTGTAPTYDNLWPANATWSWPYDARPYRCMWTNEVR